MEDRYFRILSLDKPKWDVGSPIIFEKGALLHDNTINKNLLQLQFKNVGTKVIKAMSVIVDCIDTINDGILETIGQEYLDLDVNVNDCFGSNIPLYLNIDKSRHFKITIGKVIYNNESQGMNILLSDIQSPSSLSDLNELAGQLIEDVHSKYPNITCSTIPEEHSYYWYCICGAININTEKFCRVCNSEKEILLSLLNKSSKTSVFFKVF